MMRKCWDAWKVVGGQDPQNTLKALWAGCGFAKFDLKTGPAVEFL